MSGACIVPAKPMTWQRNGTGWVLLAGRLCFGCSKHPRMWQSALSGGRVSDLVNIAWARNPVRVAVERELEGEARQSIATAPPKCSAKGDVFIRPRSPVPSNQNSETELPTAAPGGSGGAS
jgi:hypothetical protein